MTLDVMHAAIYQEPTDAHRRIRWTPESEDMHLNLVDLLAGEEILEHVNASLDVVLTCLDGDGTLVVDGERVALKPGSIAMIRKGRRRGITAGPDGMRYTTCHGKRGGLMPGLSTR